MPETIAMAVSGGVDSLVGAFLLKTQGHRVIGLHFFTGYGPSPDSPMPARRENIAALGKHLGIPVHLVDLREVFRRRVVDHFVASYRAGRTPNPCMVCNAAVKFGALLEAAGRRGADRLATGHYARTRLDGAGRVHLMKGADPAKDQSYFLARLTPAQLAAAVFPLGGRTKAAVRALAETQGLSSLAAPESQDVCFIRDGAYNEFLHQEAGVGDAPGPIVDVDGNILGEHRGIHRFTVGQRRGINLPASEPYYVLRLEPDGNRLEVGFRRHLSVSSCTVSDVNWIAGIPASPISAHTRVRYRHTAAASVVTPLDGGRRAHVAFLAPQDAVAPGQGAVFYWDDEVLGGGWIDG